MYCRKCGASINDVAMFCDKCGTEVIKVKQRSYSEKYREEKNKQDINKKNQTIIENEKKRKHQDQKNPYIAASLIALSMALVLAMFPWNIVGEGIGTSFPMRIAVVVFALLADYHVTKAKQVNNLLDSKYGFKINASTLRIASGLSVFVTIIGLFALFTYGG